MTTQDLLKQAVNNLRQAAQTRKLEVDELRQILMTRSKEQQDQVNGLKQRQALSLQQAGQANDDFTTTSRRQEAQMMQVQESQVKNDYDKIKRDTDELINIKQRNIDEINQAAQAVERWTQL